MTADTKVINYAVFGAGRIMPRIVRGLKMCPQAKLYAIGCRDSEQAGRQAELQGALTSGTYRQLLDDKNVDAVYIATYNLNHYEMVTAALQAGKHVICEKPMVPTARLANELFDLAGRNHRLLMVAHKGVFLPMNKKIKEMIADGVLGDVAFMTAQYCYQGPFAADHWVFDPATGGSLMDVGVYPVSLLNYLSGAAISSVQRQTRPAYNGVDGYAQFDISYQNGRMAQGRSSLLVQTPNLLTVYGTSGYLTAADFWKSGHADYYIAGSHYELNEEMKSDFYYEIQHFTDCLLQGLTESPIMSRQAELQILQVVGKDYQPY